MQGFLSLEGNHKFVGYEGIPSLKIPRGVLTHFMFNDLLEVFGKISLMIHACIELMIPIGLAQVTLISKTSPCEPPMEEVHVGVSSRHKLSPLGLFLPIRHHDGVLVVQEIHNILLRPFCISDVSLHVASPLLRQAPNENPFLLLWTHESFLEFPISLPLFPE